MVEFSKEDSMTFRITNSGTVDEIKLFTDIIEKCRAEANKKGFRNMFNSEERAFVSEFAKQLNGDEVKHWNRT